MVETPVFGEQVKKEVSTYLWAGRQTKLPVLQPIEQIRTFFQFSLTSIYLTIFHTYKSFF